MINDSKLVCFLLVTLSVISLQNLRKLSNNSSHFLQLFFILKAYLRLSFDRMKNDKTLKGSGHFCSAQYLHKHREFAQYLPHEQKKS